jgi:hypothetical protein
LVVDTAGGTVTGFLSPAAGTFDYRAGIAGTVVIPSGVIVSGWTAHNTSGGATMTINGGQTITIPANTQIFDSPPLGSLVGPTFVFTSTDDYYISLIS